MVKYRSPPTVQDVKFVAANMRAPDREEVAAASGSLNPFDTLMLGVEASLPHCWTMVHERPVAIFGVSPADDGCGTPWLLATDEMFAMPGAARTLVKDGHWYIRRMLGFYPHLMNYVDARNDRSIRWLTHLGFEIHPARPYGVSNLPFHCFEMKAAQCAIQ